jgi:protein SCO1/2
MATNWTWAAVAGGALGAVLIGTVAAITLAPRGDVFAQCRGGQVAGGDIGGAFTLVDENGATVTDRDVITAPTIVYFGYTFCPDICPMDTQRNAFAIEELEDRGIIANGLFISIDPERDTPEVLREFTANFHDRLLGLTGTADQVAAASRAYRTFYQKEEDGDPEYYLMSHSTTTYLDMPGVGFVDFVNRDATPEEIADRVQCFVEAAG